MFFLCLRLMFFFMFIFFLCIRFMFVLYFFLCLCFFYVYVSLCFMFFLYLDLFYVYVFFLCFIFYVYVFCMFMFFVCLGLSLKGNNIINIIINENVSSRRLHYAYFFLYNVQSIYSILILKSVFFYSTVNFMI